MPFNAFMFADDLILLSISVRDLQLMVNMICEELIDLDMTINIVKSCSVKIGQNYEVNPKEILIDTNYNVLQWRSSMKYLGLTFSSGKKLKCDFHMIKSRLFASINGILGKKIVILI